MNGQFIYYNQDQIDYYIIDQSIKKVRKPFVLTGSIQNNIL